MKVTLKTCCLDASWPAGNWQKIGLHGETSAGLI